RRRAKPVGVPRALRSDEHGHDNPRAWRTGHRGDHVSTPRWTKRERPHARLAPGPGEVVAARAGAVHVDRARAGRGCLQGATKGRAEAPLAPETDRDPQRDTGVCGGALLTPEYLPRPCDREGTRALGTRGRVFRDRGHRETGPRR